MFNYRPTIKDASDRKPSLLVEKSNEEESNEENKGFQTLAANEDFIDNLRQCSDNFGTVMENQGFQIIGNPSEPYENRRAEIPNVTIRNIYASGSAGAFLVRDFYYAELINFANCNNNIEYTGGTYTMLGGGSIYIENCATVIIYNMRFLNSKFNDIINSSESIGGGGIAINNCGTVIVQNCYFRDCETTVGTRTGAGGGGLVINNCESTTIFNCVFENCRALGSSSGGAISLNNDTLPSETSNIRQCTFRNCMSSTLGGAISLRNCPAFVRECLFDNTTAAIGGAINLYANSVAAVFSSEFRNCSAQYGGGISNEAGMITIANSTFHGCNSNYGGGHFDSGVLGAESYIINCTFVNNLATTDGGAICTVGDTTLRINNTLLYNNSIINPGNNSVPGSNITGNYISEGYNFINSATVTNPTIGPGDITNIVDPQIGPVQNNGGDTLTAALLPTSPLINRGNNDLIENIPVFFQTVPGSTWIPNDQRLDGYPRIFDIIVDIGAYEYQEIVCFSGDSEIYVRDKNTGQVQTITADKVYSDIHEVFDTQEQMFVPIIYNILTRTGKSKNIYKIPKDLIGPNQPNKDFFITIGHPIMINGVEIYPQNISGAEIINFGDKYVYSICTDRRRPILINGLNVMTWDQAGWCDTVAKQKISWLDNKPYMSSD